MLKNILLGDQIFLIIVYIKNHK